MKNKIEVVEFFKDTQFELDGTLEENYTNTNVLEFASRENGNVLEETPGQKDIDDAYDLRAKLKVLSYVSSVDIEEVDEWVNINVEVYENV